MSGDLQRLRDAIVRLHGYAGDEWGREADEASVEALAAANVVIPVVPDTAMFSDLSLRDYFAAKALTLIAAADVMVALQKTAIKNAMSPADVTARYAYSVADAMLKERAK